MSLSLTFLLESGMMEASRVAQGAQGTRWVSRTDEGDRWMRGARLRMEANREPDIGSLIERALDGLEQTARDAALGLASVAERDLSRLEAAFELGESRMRQMPGPQRG